MGTHVVSLYLLAATGGTPQWADIAQTGGAVGLLSLLVVGFLRGWIVPGWVFSRVERDRDYYRDLAHRGTEIADRQTVVAEVLSERLLGEDRSSRLAVQAALLRERERDAR